MMVTIGGLGDLRLEMRLCVTHYNLRLCLIPGDLANLRQGVDSGSEDISDLLELRNSLYSDEFRKIVEKITCSPSLSSKVE